jgi:hypothetical protein
VSIFAVNLPMAASCLFVGRAAPLAGTPRDATRTLIMIINRNVQHEERPDTEKLRRKIAEHTEAYLAAGGKVTYLSSGQTGVDDPSTPSHQWNGSSFERIGKK